MARRDIEFDAEGVTPAWMVLSGRGQPRPRRSSWPTASPRSRRCTWTSSPRCSRGRAERAGLRQPQLRRQRRQPRLEIDPWAQVRDYRHAITYAITLPETDAAGSASGAAVTPAATYWSSGPSTAGSRRSWPRSRWSAATTTCGRWSGRTSSPGSARCSTPTGWPASRARSRPWSRSWRRTPSTHRRCPPPTPGSGSPRRVRPGAELEERGHAAHGRDAGRVQPGRLHRPDQPDPATHAAGGARPAHPIRARPRCLREGPRAQDGG